MKTPINVAITGAAGQIGYALAFRVASGALLGQDQPINLHLLEITPALPTLQGVVMELNDCAFPTLNKIVATDDARVAFREVLRQRIAPLHDEVRDHAMELDSVVEAGVGELLEVLDGFRGILLVELRGDRPAIGLESGSLHGNLRRGMPYNNGAVAALCAASSWGAALMGRASGLRPRSACATEAGALPHRNSVPMSEARCADARHERCALSGARAARA